MKMNILGNIFRTKGSYDLSGAVKKQNKLVEKLVSLNNLIEISQKAIDAKLNKLKTSDAKHTKLSNQKEDLEKLKKSLNETIKNSTGEEHNSSIDTQDLNQKTQTSQLYREVTKKIDNVQKFLKKNNFLDSNLIKINKSFDEFKNSKMTNKHNPVNFFKKPELSKFNRNDFKRTPVNNSTLFNSELLKLDEGKSIFDEAKYNQTTRNQLIDAGLANVYAQKIDDFKKKYGESSETGQKFLFEIGKVCKENGVKCTQNKNGTWVVNGAGAHPIIYPISQDIFVKFKMNLKLSNNNTKMCAQLISDITKKVYKKTDKLCKQENRITTSELRSLLDDVEKKVLDGTVNKVN